MSTELPTVGEIIATANRIHDEGLAAWPSMSLHVSSLGELRYQMYTPQYDAFDSRTLEGLADAAREAINQNDPAKDLREKAEKLGFELVKKGGAE